MTTTTGTRDKRRSRNNNTQSIHTLWSTSGAKKVYSLIWGWKKLHQKPPKEHSKQSKTSQKKDDRKSQESSDDVFEEKEGEWLNCQFKNSWWKKRWGESCRSSLYVFQGWQTRISNWREFESECSLRQSAQFCSLIFIEGSFSLAYSHTANIMRFVYC